MSKAYNTDSDSSTPPVQPNMLYIPQGCYGEISLRGSDQFRWIGTANVKTCSHILVSNARTGRAILCHADTGTDLKDELNGIPKWITTVCEGDNLEGLKIDIGENADPSQSRLKVWMSRVDGEPFYYKQVLDSLNSIGAAEPEKYITNKCTQVMDDLSKSKTTESYGVVYDIQTNSIHELMEAELPAHLENDLNLPGLMIQSTEDFMRHTNLYALLRHAPVCINSGNRLLGIDEIKNNLQNYGITLEVVPASNEASESDKSHVSHNMDDLPISASSDEERKGPQAPILHTPTHFTNDSSKIEDDDGEEITYAPRMISRMIENTPQVSQNDVDSNVSMPTPARITHDTATYIPFTYDPV